MLYYISPELGIKFTDDSHFGEERTLSKDELRELLCNDTKLIPRHYSGKDVKDPPKMDIFEYLDHLYKGKEKISKVEQKRVGENEVIYTIYRTLEDIYHHHGMVVTLRRVHDRWYVTSIAHRQWGV
jgi:hypothetical protein